MTNLPADRDSFYDDDPQDDADEYELLPPDDEIIAGEQARAAQAVRDAADRARSDELFKGPAELSARELLQEMPEFKFRFSTKHLLIAMTLLAVGLGLAYKLGSIAVLIILVFVSLAAAYGYVSWKEHQHREAWYRERIVDADQQQSEES
jgi:hypothetical protein